MTDSRPPAPLFYAALLNKLCSCDPWGATADSVFGGLIEILTDQEACWFGPALGDLLRLLEGDRDRLRFVAETMVVFDLTDAAAGLAAAAERTGDLDVVLAAASVSGNPATGAAIRRRVAQLVGSDRFGRIRLFPEKMDPRSDAEELLMQQCLPGRRRDEQHPRLPAVIVVDKALGTRAALWVALQTVSCKAVALQFTPGCRVPDWFGPATVLVCSEQTSQAVRRQLRPGRTLKSVIVAGIDAYTDTADILQRANALLPPRLRLAVPVSET